VIDPCRALQIVCAAPDRESLQALKEAAVAADWELTPGATTAEDALDQIGERRASVLVVREPVPGLVGAARERFPDVRVVVVGDGPGTPHAAVTSLAEVRGAILGAPA
jgi:hypothetical protein